MSGPAQSQSSSHAWLPVLRTDRFHLPTAVNLVAFSALAYSEGADEGSAVHVLESLRSGQEPRRFGKTEARLVLEAAPLSAALRGPHMESHLRVEVFLASNDDQAIIFAQGTDNLLAVLLDSAKAQIGRDTALSLKSLVSGGRVALERRLTQISSLFGTEINLTEFLDHKTAMFQHLTSPANQGAHAGFMMLAGAFLHSPSFRQAAVDHDIFRKQLFMTGHSLGGAMALLLARELQPLCRKRIHVYTFGCPRVGSASFVRTFPRRMLHYRVVNQRDPVAWMASGPQWEDHGLLRFLSPSEPPAVLREAVRDRDWPPDHLIRQYVTQLGKCLLSPNTPADASQDTPGNIQNADGPCRDSQPPAPRGS